MAKKVINIVERIDYIPEFKRKNNSIIDDKKDSKKIKKDTKKSKVKIKLKTLCKRIYSQIKIL